MSRPSRIPGITSTRTLLLLPTIPDDLDPELKNGLAIRNAASTNGRCPDCGATGELYLDTQHDGIYHLVFEHEHDCHALTDGTAA